MRYRAITFDMGYTLAWVRPFEDIYLQACRDCGVEASSAALQVAVDAVWQEVVQRDATASFDPTEAYDRQWWHDTSLATLKLAGIAQGAGCIAQRFSQILDEPQSYKVYPDAFPVLGRLRQEGYILGVVSNWGWGLPEMCVSLGLAPYFDFILASSRAGSAKPHPGIFHKALELAGVPAEQVMHVGDSLWADVQGASAVGIRGVLLDRSGSGHSEYPVIYDLGEIFKLLETQR